MTTSTGNLRRLTFNDDQATVPAATRATDLLDRAKFIADNTDPFQLLELAPEDRLPLAMALPNLPDEDTERLMLNMVAELHTAEQHDLSDDHNQHDAQQAEVHRQSAAGLARDAVEADLRVPRDRRAVELSRMSKRDLVARYRALGGIGGIHPPEKWSADDLIASILSMEFPGGAR